MIGRLLRRIRIALPPTWVVAIFFVGWLAAWLGELFCRITLGRSDPATFQSVVLPFRCFQSAVATSAALLFALWRVYLFHPLANWEYAQWLKQMPWTRERPLPMGSALPGVVDAILVVMLCWMAGTAWPVSPVAPLLAYLSALTFVACVVAGFTQQRRALYAILFGVGLAIRLAFNPFWPLAVLVALFPLVVFVLRQSLQPDLWPKYGLTTRLLSEHRKLTPKRLGWPHMSLGPWAHPRYVAWVDALIIALLSGWFVWAGMSHLALNAEQEDIVIQLFVTPLMAVPFLRISFYVVGHYPPISLFGRLATGRWIISGYDRLFLPTLLAMLAAIAGEVIVKALAVPNAIGQPPIVVVWLFLLLGTGSSVRNWELTGEHRICFPHQSSNAGPYVKV